jgi:IS5 family transposase
MNFRHWPEQHQLARQLFKTVNRWLTEAGVMMIQGTLVDATIIGAPRSTKNKEQQRELVRQGQKFRQARQIRERLAGPFSSINAVSRAAGRC